MSIRHLSLTFKSVLTLSSAPGAIAPPPSSVPRGEIDSNQPRYLPTAPSSVKLYTFPTPDKYAVELPTLKSLILEKSDPQKINIVIEEPVDSNKGAIIAGPRMLTIRRKKMKKHKRRKRYFRDLHKYNTYHRRKKAKAEFLFRQKMAEYMHDLETFDPLDHVKDTISKAKREWSTSLAPSGRKKYPHWSQLMAVEELYGLPKVTHIDVKAGRPSQEDAQKIAQLRKDYFKQYTRMAKKKAD